MAEIAIGSLLLQGLIFGTMFAATGEIVHAASEGIKGLINKQPEKEEKTKTTSAKEKLDFMKGAILKAGLGANNN
jgi:protein tyrosine phosphatase (PTP) superfamily phosphohydrolase (DUF442 family)